MVHYSKFIERTKNMWEIKRNLEYNSYYINNLQLKVTLTLLSNYSNLPHPFTKASASLL